HAGQFRVFNQFTEMFTVLQLAQMVKKQAEKLGHTVRIEHLENPRTEAETHYYNPRHSKLLELGLVPQLLTDVLLTGMLRRIRARAHRIKREILQPTVRWHQPSKFHAHPQLVRAGKTSSKGSVFPVNPPPLPQPAAPDRFSRPQTDEDISSIA